MKDLKLTARRADVSADSVLQVTVELEDVNTKELWRYVETEDLQDILDLHETVHILDCIPEYEIFEYLDDDAIKEYAERHLNMSENE